MAQNWKLPIPLVDPHGNFGAVDGSGAAAMRYTEARISKYTEDVCMKDLPFFKDQFIPNFDGTETEPTFLPFQVPNILVSGSTGIAVGMATNIPTHNLGEVIDATVAYLNDPEIELEGTVKTHAGTLILPQVESSMPHLRNCTMCMPQDLARSRCAVR